MISCACGCGVLIEPFDSRGRSHKFIHGHSNRHPSPERIKNLSNSLKGEKNPFYGKHHTEESNRLNRDKHLGKKSSVWKGGKKFAIARANQKRRHGLFGFIPLNNCEIDGWVGHHIDYNYVIYIPYELHHSIYHSVTKDINMNMINDKVYEWFIEYYGLI